MRFEEKKAEFEYLADAIRLFIQYKKIAESALKQINDEEFFAVAGSGQNSAAIIVKHISGNQRSRWRNFLTEDGEKPDRDRDSEFENEGNSRRELMKRWEEGWQMLFDSLSEIGADDLMRTVRIRGREHSVLQAVNRQLTHYPYHIGQIVLLAKGFRGKRWKSLSVPKGRSLEFNERLKDQLAAGDESGHYLESALLFDEKELRGREEE